MKRLVCLMHKRHMKHTKSSENFLCLSKKALRMTMAFSEENMDYIRTMGKLESGGATAYVNRLIEADRRKHADVYLQMKTLRPDA